MAEDKYKLDYERWNGVQGLFRWQEKKISRSTRKPATQVAAVGIPLQQIDHDSNGLGSSPLKQIASMSDGTHGKTYSNHIWLLWTYKSYAQ